MTKISHISWGGYDKGFYGILENNITKIKEMFKDLRLK